MVSLVEYSCIGGSPLHGRNHKGCANLSTLTHMTVSFGIVLQEKRETELDRDGDPNSLKRGLSLLAHVTRCYGGVKGA